ncbi:hypothetical protein ACWGCK_39505, partial [Streptomyces virginiae]
IGVSGTGGGTNPGVSGTGSAGAGVTGTSTQGIGVSGTGGGTSAGVKGTSTGGPGLSGTSVNGAGVSAASTKGYGVAGTSTEGIGVYGIGGGAYSGVYGSGKAGPGVTGNSTQGVGVLGAGGGTSPGVRGTSTGGPGLLGDSTNGAGVDARSSTATGLVASGGYAGIAATGTKFAAVLTGDVVITGILRNRVNRLVIDHPLHPRDRYLTHASVESSEMKNVYDGTVVLDADGQATVELPDWFEALNDSFRYQLTAIGAPAPDLHVSRRVSDHVFGIAGGPAGLEVSWQITGVRCDDWAMAHPLTPDEEKPAEEQDHLRHPELLGLPQDRFLAPVDAAPSPNGSY